MTAQEKVRALRCAIVVAEVLRPVFDIVLMYCTTVRGNPHAQTGKMGKRKQKQNPNFTWNAMLRRPQGDRRSKKTL